MNPMYELWPHQKKTLQFAKNNSLVFDTSTAGTGKTPAHIRITAYRHLKEGVTRTLIICPKTLMQSAWANDLELFEPDLKYVLAYPPRESREEAFAKSSDIVIVNTDALKFLASKGKRWLKKMMGAKPAVIIDESSWLKTPGALRTKAAFEIAPSFTFRSILSGTPAPNTVTELWSQVKILDGGHRLGDRFTRFKHIMQEPVFCGGFTKWRDKPDANLIAYGLIHDITIGHRFDDVMTHVPPMEHRVLHHYLPAKHLKIYKELEKTSFLDLKDNTVTAFNAGVLANKLLQCASGAVYNDPTHLERGWSVIDKSRYELIADLVEARQQTVVFFLWHHQKEEIARELKIRKIPFGILDSTVKDSYVRSETVSQFQEGNLRCILMHPKTGAHGLTLTKALTVIWASPTYNSDIKEQGDARIRRGKQDKPTESIVILARGTKDEHAYDVFVGKKTLMDSLNELLANSKK